MYTTTTAKEELHLKLSSLSVAILKIIKTVWKNKSILKQIVWDGILILVSQAVRYLSYC